MSRGPDSEDDPSGDPTDVAPGLPPAAGADDGRRRRQTPRTSLHRAGQRANTSTATVQPRNRKRGVGRSTITQRTSDHHELGSRRGEGADVRASGVPPASSGAGIPDISQEHSFVSPTHTRHGAHPDARDTVHRDDAATRTSTATHRDGTDHAHDHDSQHRDDAGRTHEHDDHGMGCLRGCGRRCPLGMGIVTARHQLTRLWRAVSAAFGR
ncbi:MAG: hypothetical protein WKH64_01755 [Chloroflexia bacterium]